MALRTRRYLVSRNASHPTQWNCRIRIATGPVIESLVEFQKYVYDVVGPAPNLAARLESLSAAMEITLGGDSYNLIRDEFIISERGQVEVKDFGLQTLYTLESQTGSKV